MNHDLNYCVARGGATTSLSYKACNTVDSNAIKDIHHLGKYAKKSEHLRPFLVKFL